ncbi:MAG TPA: hypothetical protein VFZ59_17165 [Verrucomicrobiae bacterium]|nr:hypothetical protein [Verrucomicrobiae bacterium]
MNTRRQFLIISSTAVAALGFAPSSTVSLAMAGGARHRSLEELSYADFAEQVNTPFRVRLSPSRIVELSLLKAPLAAPTNVIAGRPPGDAGNEKFSLIFAGPENMLLDSAIHRFEHRELGEFDMYIGRIGAPLNGEVRYEAGFNRPIATTRGLI